MASRISTPKVIVLRADSLPSQRFGDTLSGIEMDSVPTLNSIKDFFANSLSASLASIISMFGIGNSVAKREAEHDSFHRPTVKGHYSSDARTQMKTVLGPAYYTDTQRYARRAGNA